MTLRKNNTHKANMIHHMVATAFKGKRPIGLVVLHADNVKTNNFEWNLSYGTKAKNTQDYYVSIGKQSNKIPIQDIPSIINRINSGEQIVTIAQEYHVRRNDIAVINKIILLTGDELAINL